MKVLERMGFGEVMRKWMEVMYEEAEAVVEVNGQFSKPFDMERGVKQGCALSPLLFICVLELMACAIRADNMIEGTGYSDQKDKLSLYADDSALIVEGAIEGVTEGSVVIKQYERATGSELHSGKTNILLLGKAKDGKVGQNSFRMRGIEYSVWSKKTGVKYLGDVIGHKITEEERFGEGVREMRRVGKRR